jgi:hypothetical protein
VTAGCHNRLERPEGYGATSSIAVTCISVSSTHDNVVQPKETSSVVKRGGKDFEVEGASHLAILFNPVVAREVATFLAERGA